MPENFENQNEKEIKIEKKEILGERFLEILESPNFLKALTMAGNKTAKSGYETSFHVNILESGKHYIGHVFIGNVDGMAYSEEKIEIDGDDRRDDRTHKSGTLLGFHFHPRDPSEERIEPSGEDLTTLHVDNFMGVGQIGKYIEILLVRKKLSISDSEIDENAEAYDEEISKREPISTQEEVQKILENNGFEAFYIVFNKRKNKYELSKESKKRILEIKGIKVEMADLETGFD